LNKNFPNGGPELTGQSKVVTALEELKYKNGSISLKRGIAENVKCKM
jgi:hypothetical protein